MIQNLIKKVLLGCMCLLGLPVYAMTSDNAAGDSKEEKKSEQQMTNDTRPSPRNTNDLNVLLMVLSLSKNMPSRLINAEYLNKMVQRFLNNGSNPNELIVRKTTLLNLLVEMGDDYLPLITMLIDHGVRFDKQNGADETAFATAQHTRGTEKILAFFSQRVLQHQDMRSDYIRSKQPPPLVESLSSSSSSASAISAPHLTIEVPSEIAQQVSTTQVVQEHGGQHKRTVSTSFLMPPIDPSEVQIPVTGRTEPTIQEEKQQEDDMSIYELPENTVRSPESKKNSALTIDMSRLQSSHQKNPESVKTPHNSAVESGKSTATTPSTIRHDIGAAFPSVPSDRSTTSDSQRVAMPVAPPNSAKTSSSRSVSNKSEALSEHRLAVSRENDHSQDAQRSNAASSGTVPPMDLLTIISNPMRDETKEQSDRQMEASEVVDMQTSNVLPHMVQAISVVSVPQIEADAMSPISSSPPHPMSGSQTAVSQHEMSKNRNDTITELDVQKRAAYVRSPAIVSHDPSQEQNQVQPAWGQWTGNPVVVRTKLPWYKRFFCCCGGNSQ